MLIVTSVSGDLLNLRALNKCFFASSVLPSLRSKLPKLSNASIKFGFIEIAFSRYSLDCLFWFVFDLINPKLFRTKISFGLKLSALFNIFNASSFLPKADKANAVAL